MSFGNINPFFTNVGDASSTASGMVTTGTQTFAGNKTFTGATGAGYAVTVNKTSQSSAAELIQKWLVSDDAIGYIALENGNATDAIFSPWFELRAQGSTRTNNIVFASQTDSGTTDIANFRFKTIAGAAIATRPLMGWLNGANTVLQALPLNSGANMALSWGTQTGAVPAFTTRAAGTRLILYSAITASKVDNAIGVAASGAANTYSVQEATSSYKHSFYGGTTEHFVARADGFTYAPNAGGGFGVKEGTNATMGTATLVAGAVTVATTKVTANSRIFLTGNSDGGTPGWVRVSARNAGQDFTITSSNGADTGTVAWIIMEPAP